MTLRELLELTKGTKSSGAIPKSQLLGRHERILARSESLMGKGSIKVSIKVYESGYVLYQEDKRYTVFHINDIRDRAQEYGSVKEGSANAISSEMFLSSDWTLRLTLEGNDRIVHNREKVERDHVAYSYSCMGDHLDELGETEEFKTDIEAEIVRERMLKVFDIVREELKPAQWNVYVLIEKQGKKQKEVADCLGISQQAVSKDYKRAMERIEMLRKSLKDFFYED